VSDRAYTHRFGTTDVVRDSRGDVIGPNENYHREVFYDGQEFFDSDGVVWEPDAVPAWILTQLADEKPAPAPLPGPEEINVADILEGEVPFLDANNNYHAPKRGRRG
jgi:hypothetical protein